MDGIALDPEAGKMYWVNGSPRSIQRADLDGANVETLVTSDDGLYSPEGIALDLEAGKMYWTDRAADRIKRANLDGSYVEELVTADLYSVGGIALESIFKGILPYLVAITVGILILALFPEIILVLPNLMY